MGKRELLLIAGFVLIGTMVYYATVPAGAPNEKGMSVSKLLEEVRRELHGNPGSAEASSSTVVPLPDGATELRIEVGNTPLTIVGEARTDIACDLSVRSNGYDDAEAAKLAQATKIKFNDAGATMVLGIDYPEPGAQRATLALKVPKSLAVRIQPSRGRLEISDVNAAEIVEARGQTAVRRVSRLVATHRGGKLEMEDIASLKLNTRGSAIWLTRVKGDAILQIQAGELRASAIGGPIELESNNSKVVIEDLAATRKSVRMNTVGGSVNLTGVSSEVRIDGRDTRVTVTLEKPAPLAIYTEGGEPIEVTLPDGGVKLDALATDSRLTVPEGLAEVKVDGEEQRVTASIAGGGPTITLRTVRGNITIKTKKPDTD
ncbi:MAG TPA: DUF4097 family beta strand repeat-containing protein [Vicinamibacterales bacterium]|jgi:hypothetical protein